MGFEDDTWMRAPLDSAAVGAGNDDMISIKAAVVTLMALEHNVQGGVAAMQGWHKAGSAFAFYVGSTPPTLPGGGVFSDSDRGRIWIDTTGMSSTVPPVLKVYVGTDVAPGKASGWAPVSVATAALATLATTATHIPTAQADVVAGAIWVT